MSDNSSIFTTGFSPFSTKGVFLSFSQFQKHAAGYGLLCVK